MRTEGDFIKINEWLLPFSWLFEMIVRLRNTLFDMEIIKSRAYDVPVISVGNITVGGAGKTPHTEYLVRLLKKHVKVAVLSRGYKRKTRGYLLANSQSTMQEIGDEPMQMKTKFPDLTIAVDGNRRRGIDRLTHDEDTKDTDVILLDDAFQHRYVKPGINILLVDYHRLIIYDKMLPAGRLREPQSGKNRADIVIITKCPKDLKPMEFRVLTKAMNLYPYQSLYFSTIDYNDLIPVYGNGKGSLPLQSIQGKNILLLTGIASPDQLIVDLKGYQTQITQLAYADHHHFSRKDQEHINAVYEAMEEPKMIITTEKDAARLHTAEHLTQEVCDAMFALPIKVRFLLDQEENFNNQIISYVRKNSRNSILVKRKDDHKPKDGNHTGDRARTISFRNN